MKTMIINGKAFRSISTDSEEYKNLMAKCSDEAFAEELQAEADEYRERENNYHGGK